MRTLIIILSAIFMISSALAQDEAALIISRDESRKIRAELIRRETKELRLSTYIFDLDEVGKETLGLLADAAQRGVKVQVSVDGLFTSLPKNYAVLKALKASGVEVKLYNPIFRNAISANYRNHMKSMIGTNFLIVGDRNINAHYYKRNSEVPFMGMDVLVRGDQVNVAAKHFDEVYAASQMKPEGSVFVSKEKTNAAILELNQWRDQAVAKHVINTPRILKDNKTIVPDEVRYVADLPEGKFNKNQNGLHVKFLDMINRATTSLEFSNPYILFPPDTKAAIKAAIDRGVKVKLNTNSVRTNDNHLMAMAWDVHKDEIIAMGIEVNEVKDGNFLHAKTVIKDADEVFIGSFNLDPRSKNLNLENGVFIKSKKMADTLLNYNRRLEKYFMTRAEKVVPTNVPLNQKMSNCVKKGLRKFVVGVMYRAL